METNNKKRLIVRNKIEGNKIAEVIGKILGIVEETLDKCQCDECKCKMADENIGFEVIEGSFSLWSKENLRRNR